jgi:hypothetical protein
MAGNRHVIKPAPQEIPKHRGGPLFLAGSACLRVNEGPLTVRLP